MQQVGVSGLFGWNSRRVEFELGLVHARTEKQCVEIR